MLYAIVEIGVYRHSIGGIFSTLDRAMEEARTRVFAEEDRYHSWQVVEFELDKPVYDGVTLKEVEGFRRDKNKILIHSDNFSVHT